MTEPEPREPQSHIFWHPLIVLVLERYLPAGWQLTPEFQLSRMPQRVDIVVLRLVEQIAGAPRRLHSIFDHLRPHTLIEYKSPTDDLDGSDAIVLLGYAMQYMVLTGLQDPGELCLMVLCDRIPLSFPKQIQRFGGRFEQRGGGLWAGTVAGMTLHGVETRAAYADGPTERLLYAFSRAFLKDPLAGLIPADEEDAKVYVALSEQIAQIRRTKGAMATKEIDAAAESFEAAVARLLNSLPPERLPRFLEALAPDPARRLVCLQALAPDPAQRLAGLAPEQRLAGLGAQQILEGLSPEVRAALEEKLRH